MLMGSMSRPGAPMAVEIAEARRAVETRLVQLFPDGHSRDLVEAAMRDAVRAPGKRLRMLMAILGARDLGWDGPASVEVGCAVELVHTASLVLDDLPCMDNAPTRRGLPAIHVGFGEDVAVLCAIALLTRAFGLLAAAPGLAPAQRIEAVAILSDAVGQNGLVGGQLADLRGGSRSPGGALAINDRKTAVLFVAALEIACVIAGGSAECRGRFVAFGRELGQAFQIHDDLVDLQGDAVVAGKPIGQDAGKPTLVRLVGLEAARARLTHHVDAASAALRELPGGGARLTHLVETIFADAAVPAPVQRLTDHSASAG